MIDVSVCIPVYNAEKYLKESLDSIKKQTFKSIEVIISDDQSKDNTLKIANEFKKRG
ncbi:glycosyltransferase [Chryseobacterium sp. POE27]|uniref:glycosyltransferase family 2 protein n=1 Tax=Chryseobacterium sp. POE27 TaxID=3138177 RepID=UPI003219021B